MLHRLIPCNPRDAATLEAPRSYSITEEPFGGLTFGGQLQLLSGSPIVSTELVRAGHTRMKHHVRGDDHKSVPITATTASQI